MQHDTPPTAPDLVRCARDESDEALRRELMQAAERAALDDDTMRSAYLVEIAGEYLEWGWRADAKRVLPLALDHAEDRIWTHRNAARHWIALGDKDSARDALQRYEDVLRDKGGPGYLWRLLAEGWANDLSDPDGAARCLSRALATAQNVDDYCSAGIGLLELAGDIDGARAAIDRAIELAEAGDAQRDWWTLANVYSHIDDEVNARSMLLRGSDAANTVKDHLIMAAAWSSQYPGVPEARASIQAAEHLAATANELVEVADAYYEHTSDEDAIRSCLEAALKQADAPDHHCRIARAFRLWLDDRDRADAIAPAGVAPEVAAPAQFSLDGWSPDASALLDWLRPQMTSERLRDIAGADYGMDFDRHLSVLQEIVESGLIPRPFDWYPQEVLQLTRWSEGATVDHVTRAFACTVLCIASIDIDGSDADAIILLESCLALGEDAVKHARDLFVMLVEATAWVDEDGVDHAPDALIALLLAAGADDPGDPRLEELASLALQVNGLQELFTDGMRYRLWRRLADDILPHVVSAQPDAVSLATLKQHLETF